MDFDALRAAVVPGDGVVGRWPGLVCVADCADRAVLRRLLDVCAGTAGPDPGRTLARRLGLSPGHLANLRSAGKTPVPYLLLGSAVRYRLSDVEAYEASSVVMAVV